MAAINDIGTNAPVGITSTNPGNLTMDHTATLISPSSCRSTVSRRQCSVSQVFSVSLKDTLNTKSDERQYEDNSVLCPKKSYL